MGKKKFFDKKKSATFQLMARDTSDPNYSSDPSGDRVFVRVDSNPYTPSSLEGMQNYDASDDYDDEDDYDHKSEVRRMEILELGFPDDGYNYLAHMRKINNTAPIAVKSMIGSNQLCVSTYFNNPKAAADLHLIPQDVKAYDASRVEVSSLNDAVEKSLHRVASKTVKVRVNKVLDPEIAAILDGRNSSDYGSDVEYLEDDFVVKANLFEGCVGEEHVEKLRVEDPIVSVSTENSSPSSYLGNEKPRVRRQLDDQFDMLELNEYGSDDEEGLNGYMDEEHCQESFTEKLSNAFKHHLDNEALDYVLPECDVIRRCREYAEKFEDQDDDREVVLVEESSDESEVWDCETIVTPYSTLDNHPCKIGAPEARRKKKLAEALSGSATGINQLITLKGKERLPLDFLPSNRKRGGEKTKDVTKQKSVALVKKPRAQETKEEKKERKSAVKSERREARQLRKEVKEVYTSEARNAQKVAASTGPSSIHLM